MLSIGYRPTMAEDGQGPGLPKVAEIEDVGEIVDGLDSLAVSSEGSDDDKNNPNAAGLAIVPFGPPPPTEDCPVCFIPLPRSMAHITYMVCCGKEMCSACFCESERVLNVKNAKRAEKKLKPFPWLCPFCRAPKQRSQEHTPATASEYQRPAPPTERSKTRSDKSRGAQVWSDLARPNSLRSQRAWTSSRRLLSLPIRGEPCQPIERSVCVRGSTGTILCARV